MDINYDALQLAQKRGPKIKYTQEVIDQLKMLANKGYSQMSISNATGIPQRSVCMLLKRK
ncbi:hypothetical protein [Shewanella xiamenensis]|uniref:hypothetical protein n=1 Tax=Shewanella xiamenensis TaxID=332186 RepID=UPI0021BF9AF5|nr:hypothetical protein [Shewanella xiamenensis]MCT8876667.1 hypothetical protein [Shewanella xiamenensis]